MRQINFRQVKNLLCFSLLLLVSTSSFADRPKEDLARDQSSKPHQVIELMQVQQGDSVLDLFGGGGYYAELLSEKVGGDGRVVLHNNKAYLKYVGKALEARLKDSRLSNVASVIKEAESLQLKDNQFDKVFYVLGYHDLYFESDEWRVKVGQIIPQIYRALKPKGRILIIDHQAQKGSGATAAQHLHRIESDFVVKDMQKQGFKLVESSDLLINQIDKLDRNVFESDLRRKTSRFILIFEKQ